MKIFDNHRVLFGMVAGMFILLTLPVAIIPALENQKNFAPLPNSRALTAEEQAGKNLYIANGCVACHTQQVRNVRMDEPWGSRPSIAADYARIHRTDLWRNTATLMGSERTGPDLTDIGNRQPSDTWQLMHLYNPRSVVDASIMPAYPWLFEEKAAAGPGDLSVPVPDAFKPRPGVTIVARPEARQLVAYLLSLKQTPLPTGERAPQFLYAATPAVANAVAAGQGAEAAGPAKLDGAALYASNCQACHQPNGEGLKGAFPPLKGSSVVLDDSPEKMIGIIMKGYTARESEGYPAMPAIGVLNKLTAPQIQAIINHERTSWGNQAREVPLEEVEAILKKLTP
ncbi:cbb3-type cytochrome c oxidase subunit II [Horticoccus luteus]|uniref:Cbb3-type cytochrome c oxidase subunit II n=1 Tax=Horticoccus luteus TaxID=2862869 RepID=A0A8F9XKY1_9BACT|nr:cbb3-type cytochrome c oxidase subunit II [Horticoccus luteus]QYM78656.1 cbb3-type cytochrome c oxidase subunit II [Horticoccus luteus]